MMPSLLTQRHLSLHLYCSVFLSLARGAPANAPLLLSLGARALADALVAPSYAVIAPALAAFLPPADAPTTNPPLITVSSTALAPHPRRSLPDTLFLLFLLPHTPLPCRWMPRRWPCPCRSPRPPWPGPAPCPWP